MKKVVIIFLAFMAIWQGGPESSQAQNPDYEKYGRIAIAVVQADYPEDEVTDYEYKGRKKIGNNNQVEDDFLFLVVENGKELNVTVSVQHDVTNEKLLNLKVVEQKRQ